VRRPVVPRDAWYAPKHAQGFDSARGLDRAHVGRLPAELIEQTFDGLLCGRGPPQTHSQTGPTATTLNKGLDKVAPSFH
jgi:hypothetical protein